MLSNLTIENLGVISTATASLSPGFTVLTGETGAGKTMVVTGLRLLVGGRSDASRIRTGAQRAVVEGRFLTDGMSAAKTREILGELEESGGETDEDGSILVDRIVNSTGRSRAHLGGRSVPAGSLAAFGEKLLTIHGQNDQLRLLNAEAYLDALDAYSPTCQEAHRAYQEAYRRWRILANDLNHRTQQSRELAQEIDRLRYALEEIEGIDPQPDEDVELLIEVRRLQDADALREATSDALFALDGAAAFELPEDTPGAADLLDQAIQAIRGTDDPQLLQLSSRLQDTLAATSDVSSELATYLGNLPTEADALESALNRQQELKTLTRKYAPDIAGVLAWRDKARRRLSEIDVSHEALDALRSQVANAQALMQAAGAHLTEERQRAASSLGTEITRELHALAMPTSTCEVCVNTSKPGPDGMDTVDMRISGNKNSAPRSLGEVASGGELSRIMLALEVNLARSQRGTTLVFDEVDAGVGGQAAVEIGHRLARLACHHQVIVVTHLPQVAAFADTHLKIVKTTSANEIVSGVVELNEDARVAELTRMLAGLTDSDTGRAHAAELLATARARVRELRKNSDGEKIPRALPDERPVC